MILYSSSQRYGFRPQKLHGLREQNMRGWRNWQTRTFEVRVVYPWGFKSPPSHQKNPRNVEQNDDSWFFRLQLFANESGKIKST